MTLGIFDPNSTNLFEIRDDSKWETAVLFPLLGPRFSELMLDTKELQGLIRSDEKFDLVIGELFLGEPILAGLAHKFKAPLISSAIFIPHYVANYMVSVGNNI